MSYISVKKPSVHYLNQVIKVNINSLYILYFDANITLALGRESLFKQAFFLIESYNSFSTSLLCDPHISGLS